VLKHAFASHPGEFRCRKIKARRVRVTAHCMQIAYGANQQVVSLSTHYQSAPATRVHVT
jgi:hypothetical protein